MAKINRPPSIAEIIRRLEQRVRKLENSNRLTNASIKNGTLTVLSPTTGNQIFYIGKLSTGDSGMYVSRENGQIAFAMYDGGGPTQYVGIYDDSGNLVLGDDAVSKHGLARPWLPLPAYPDTGCAPGAGGFALFQSTASTSDVNAYQLATFKQQPRVQVEFYATADTGCTGVVTLYDETTNTALGTYSFDSTYTYQAYIGPVAVPSSIAFGASMELRLRLRKTGGTGNVYVRVRRATTLQS